MADPVADRSGFFCTYMSRHPDMLVAHAKHFGKVDGNVSSAIDSKVRTGGPHHTTRGQVVSRLLFSGHGLGVQDQGCVRQSAGRARLRGGVPPRLLVMRADADEALGTVRDRSPRSLFPLPFSPRGSLPPARQRPRLCHVIRSYLARVIYTGQSPADHALRGALPDLDHRLPSSLPDLQHERAAPLDIQVLVARARPPTRLPGLGFYRRVGVHGCRARLGGLVCGHPRAQASHAVAHRGPYHPFIPLYSGPLQVSPEPDILGLADGLGQLCHRFWLPGAYEAAPSYQASANRVYHEGSLIGASSCRKESTSTDVP